ncbi:MAG TPA: DUF3137 domain-containing protein [Cyclobacteriaceae bacterium]|jgi:hypothetical protein|nr:DUF3137 domain-containing protein [Cytophagales bacterium]HRE66621.1 DUF3137 domain-containing protein [Cyclobacteriaceae bacterium]HRF35187.1 DUF3137 domain-containing protein [Cyclobacteriaceae bacterium]
MTPITDFQSFYQTNLKPKLAELETIRISYAKKIKLYGLIGIGAGLAFLVFKISVWPLILIVVAIFFLYRYYAKRFGNSYKTQIIALLAQAQDLQYDHESSISRSAYDQSKIFVRTPDRFWGEDLLTGKVDKTGIWFSELHTQYKSGGKNKSWHTIFRGIFFIADFNKNFIGETYVLPDVSENIFGSGLGGFFQKLNIARPQLVKLEDVEFEKAFAIYGTDQVEARYILSPALMQRILSLKEKFNTAVALSFIGSHVYIALSISKNLFEAPWLFSSVDNYKQLEEYYNDIAMCTDIVTILDLNTRIWMKE